VVKVQSSREESIKEAIERRVKIEGLEEFYGQIVIPVERVIETRNGKKHERERKLYTGYLFAEVEYNDEILYLFRETSGVGDFVGAGPNMPPIPMKDTEVRKIVHDVSQQQTQPATPVAPEFDRGDRIKVKDGPFSGMEGDVKEINPNLGKVKVEVTVLGRPVPLDLEFWQVERL